MIRITPGMTVHQYFYGLFVNDLPMNSPLRESIGNIMKVDSGAGDGTTDSDILQEMPVDSGCGDDCKICMNNAKAFIDSIRIAYGTDKPEHIVAVLTATVDVLCCYIRG